MSAQRPMACMAAALACLILALYVLAARPLFNPDEGRYAEIPREMLASGDWVIPHLNGLAYIEKPPLQYWLSAAVFAVAGPSAFSARLVTFCAALGTLIAVCLSMRVVSGRDAAWRATWVLSGFGLFVILSQLLTLDMTLSFFLTAALAAFLAAQVMAERGERKRSCNAMLIAWTAVACGVLTKGMVAAVIPAACLGLYSLWRRDFAPWRRLHLSVGIPLFIAITLPWHWLAQSRQPDFFQFYFIREHFERFATPIADRQEPWWFFIAVLICGALPWTLPALRAVAAGWQTKQGRDPRGFDAVAFVWIWALFIAVFYSLSDSKLVPYILPAFPALAMLLGLSSETRARRDTALAGWTALVFGVAVLIGAFALPMLLTNSSRAAYFMAMRWELLLAALVLTASALVSLRRRAVDLSGAVAAVSLGACAFVLLATHAARLLAPVYSGATLAAALESNGQGRVIYSVRTYDQTLPFYWRRTVSLVDYRGELDYGLRHDPGRATPDFGQFLVRWRDDSTALAIMEPATYTALEAHQLPMQVLARDAHRLLVGHP